MFPATTLVMLTPFQPDPPGVTPLLSSIESPPLLQGVELGRRPLVFFIS
jgi:hypothetical protein